MVTFLASTHQRPAGGPNGGPHLAPGLASYRPVAARWVGLAASGATGTAPARPAAGGVLS